MKRVLIVEDDPSLLSGLKDVLSFKSYEILMANDGETGYEVALKEKPDLIILDIMLPMMDGFTFCAKLREEGNETPILMLTARGNEHEKIKGLDIGADDYVTKPFSLPELLARVRALLRRGPKGAPAVDSIRIGDVKIDFRKFEASKGEEVLKLSPKEFGILRYLAARSGEAVTRDELLDEVWGYELYPTTRTVDNHIAQLRSKVEQSPDAPRYLITVHGIGYKLVLD
jgi:DNA-binding response OmpR family regulator